VAKTKCSKGRLPFLKAALSIARELEMFFGGEVAAMEIVLDASEELAKDLGVPKWKVEEALLKFYEEALRKLGVAERMLEGARAEAAEILFSSKAGKKCYEECVESYEYILAQSVGYDLGLDYEGECVEHCFLKLAEGCLK